MYFSVLPNNDLKQGNTQGIRKPPALNKKSTTWRQLDQNLKNDFESDALTILKNFPTLIKRPFWEINSKAMKQLEPGFLDEQQKYLEKLKK